MLAEIRIDVPRAGVLLDAPNATSFQSPPVYGPISSRFLSLTKGVVMPACIAPPLLERLWRPFEWYGYSRRRIRAEMRALSQRSDATLYEWRGFRVFWPTAADPNSLVTMFVESFCRANPHYYTPSCVPWKNDAVVIDVGSCEGIFALRAVKELRASRTVAIEPGKKMASLLRETFSLNDCASKAEVVECLAGPSHGWARFNECFYDPKQAAITSFEGGKGDPIEIRTLDQIAKLCSLPCVDVIKIDAEGADFDILRGAEGILRKWKPTLLVTTYHVSSHAFQMRSWLESLALGYTFIFRGVTTMGTSEVRPVLLFAFSNS